MFCIRPAIPLKSLRSLWTSWGWTPAPFATRLRRERSIRSGLRRSSSVIESIIAPTRRTSPSMSASGSMSASCPMPGIIFITDRIDPSLPIWPIAF